ncbi:MAG: MgtC/SapB family protein [Acidobacteriota bacterium]|jgi:putative Mg2+ transporter-C (MgtC) family protein|nr:MgtC/SapB family protein [Acidobacteriota bacterium]
MEAQIILKIMLAALLGGIIGLERELAGKEAGLRTNILISMGAALFTILSIEIARGVSQADPARVAAQIVTGVGFLGAGAIIQARFSIHGLTTAATIWTVAAIGMTVGAGRYFVAFAVTLVIVLVLSLFRLSPNRVQPGTRDTAYRIHATERPAILLEIKKIIRDLGIRSSRLQLHRREDGYELETLLNASEAKQHRFLEAVLQLEGVRRVDDESL